MKRWLKLSLTSLLLSSLVFSGCGSGSVTTEEEVTLIDPVSTVNNSENPEYRNIYDAQTYSTSVYPKTKEYKFNTSSYFTGYGAYPGEKVNSGDILAYSDEGDIDKQIESMEESIADMKKQYLEYSTDAKDKIEKSEKKIKDCQRLGGAYMNDYYAEGILKKGYEEELAYKEQLYNLDLAYKESELKKLKEKKAKYQVVATEAGNVVAIQDFNYGTGVDDETLIMAVGDINVKEMKCEYINKATINRAEDVYALFNGVRYEIEYQPIDTDEYIKMDKQGISIYSTFLFKEETPDINVGDFGIIVVVKDRGEQVLSISNDAIHRDIANTYVYVLKDGSNVQTNIKCGITDGVYTEILSGITADDKVLVDDMKTYGTNTTTLAKGDFSNEIKEYGWMYYPDATAVTNTSEYGTMYLKEMMVERSQHVEKGDVICTVSVIPDKVELERVQTELKRANERLQDLIDSANRQETEEQIKAREKATALKVEDIKKIEEKIAKIQSAYAVTALYAPESGIVADITDLESQSILSKDYVVASVASEQICYIIIQDENQLLNFGNQVNVGYDNGNGGMDYTTGTVVTMSKAGVSQELRLDWALIQLPNEIVSTIAETAMGDGNWFGNNFDVDATIREMKDVLIVPKKAVTEVNGHTYVDVMDENGKVISTSFIYGGFNNDNYWVVEGLTEGMKICLK